VETDAVRLDAGGGHAEAMAALDATALAPDLFLVLSDLPRSRPDHPVKREAGVAALLVGRLAVRPKVRRMATGWPAALRDWNPTQD